MLNLTELDAFQGGNKGENGGNAVGEEGWGEIPGHK